MARETYLESKSLDAEDEKPEDPPGVAYTEYETPPGAPPGTDELTPGWDAVSDA